MQSVGEREASCSFICKIPEDLLFLKSMIIVLCVHFEKDFYLLDIQLELFTGKLCLIFALKQSRAGQGRWEVSGGTEQTGRTGCLWKPTDGHTGVPAASPPAFI